MSLPHSRLCSLVVVLAVLAAVLRMILRVVLGIILRTVFAAVLAVVLRIVLRVISHVVFHIIAVFGHLKVPPKMCLRRRLPVAIRLPFFLHALVCTASYYLSLAKQFF